MWGVSVAVVFDYRSSESYRQFLAVRSLPKSQWRGTTALVDDSYAAMLGLAPAATMTFADYRPSDYLFDYQRDIAKIAIRKRKFAAFVDCGLGKTAIIFEFANYVASTTGKPVLIVSPSMVIPQTQAEHAKFYPSANPIDRLDSSTIREWLANGNGIRICSYNILDSDMDGSRLGGLILDESSMLKSAYGKWGTACVKLGAGVPYKLCSTGTPAPNDRIEYAQTAVFLDQCRTVNEFYARYFVNRGQTDNRWEMKPHAQCRFYRDLSGWSIFLSNPAVYGWKDNSNTLPPIEVTMYDIELTAGQRDAAQAITGQFVVTSMGGITRRSKLARLSKGKDAESNKPEFIRSLCDGFGSQSRIIWCKYNDEQDALAKLLSNAANIDGGTPDSQRHDLIADFKAGRRLDLISKPKILGFGLNLQIARHHVFSTLQDSYEEYYQCLKRSNRVGSSEPLGVHIPISELDAPGVETVLRKAACVDADTKVQEALFKEQGWNYLTA